MSPDTHLSTTERARIAAEQERDANRLRMSELAQRLRAIARAE